MYQADVRNRNRAQDAMSSPEPKRQRTGEASDSVGFLTATYHTILVKVEAVKLRKTANPLRPVTEGHKAVKHYTELFKQGSYGDTRDYISVALPGMEKAKMEELVQKLKGMDEKDRNLHAADGVTPGLKEYLAGKENSVVLVDGAHRLYALKHPDVLKLGKPPTAVLYYRRDGEPMSELDVQSVGRNLNRGASIVVEMSTLDKVNSVLSVVRSVAQKEEAVSGDDDDKRLVARIRAKKEKPDTDDVLELCSRRQFFTLDKRQGRKYVTVALGLYRYNDPRESVWDTLEAMDFQNLLEYSSPKVWACPSDESQIFVLEALGRFYEKHKGKGRIKKDEKFCGEVGARPILLWDAVRDVAKKKNALDKKYLEIMVLKSSSSKARVTIRDRCMKWFTDISIAAMLDNKAFLKKLGNLAGFIEMHSKWPLSEEEKAKMEAAKNATPPKPERDSRGKSASPGTVRGRGRGGTSGDPEEVASQGVRRSKRVLQKKGEAGGERKSRRKNRPKSDFSSSSEEEKDVEVVEESEGEDGAGIGNAGKVGEAGDGDEEMNRELLSVTEKVGEGDRGAGGGEEGEGKGDKEQSGEKDGEKSAEEEGEKSSERKLPWVPEMNPSELGSIGDASRDRADEVEEEEEEESVFKEDGKKAKKPSDLLLDPIPAKWATEENRVVESMDSHGFTVTHRADGKFAYTYPRLRDHGMKNLRREEQSVSNDEVLWYVGDCVGPEGQHHICRLMFDFVGRECTINPTWKMEKEGEGEEQTKEFLKEMASALDDSAIRTTSVQQVLRSLGFRPPHDSFFCLTMRDLVLVRRIVSAGVLSRIEAFKRIWSDNGEGYDVYPIVRDAAAFALESARARLDTEGFTVFSGMLDPKSGLDNWYKGIALDAKEPHEKGEASVESAMGLVYGLFGYFQALLPTAEEYRVYTIPEKKTNAWGAIRNGAGDSTGRINNQARYTTHWSAVHDGLIEAGAGEDGYQHLRGRCIVEGIIMMLAHKLRLKYKTFAGEKEAGEENVVPEIYAPDSGGRFIATGNACRSQAAHIDFNYDKEKLAYGEDGNRLPQFEYPGYFAMVAGEEGMYLWVLPGSQKIVILPTHEMGKLAQICEMELIKVEPWSVIIMRGDVLHGGAGGKDSKKLACIRFHMYIGRNGVTLVDNINMFKGFKKRFQAAEKSDKDLRRVF